jgi:hypothetical protein
VRVPRVQVVGGHLRLDHLGRHPVLAYRGLGSGAPLRGVVAGLGAGDPGGPVDAAACRVLGRPLPGRLLRGQVAALDLVAQLFAALRVRRLVVPAAGGPVALTRPRVRSAASAKLDETRDQVARIARNTAELIGLGRDLRDDEITVLEGWAGDYYGIPVQSTLDAIRLTGSLEGMIIDPVYEGKSMAGLIDLVTKGTIPTDSTVLDAHLGGQPALNAYSALFTG